MRVLLTDLGVRPYLQDMALSLVPDQPKTLLERFAAEADEEHARAEMLAARVKELEARVAFLQAWKEAHGKACPAS